jgi:hypothetical protein
MLNFGATHLNFGATDFDFGTNISQLCLLKGCVGGWVDPPGPSKSNVLQYVVMQCVVV